jgi:BON domain-containing protein
MIPTVFGSVPGWTGMSPGPVWPGLGAASLSSLESAPVPGVAPGGTLIAAPLSTPFTIPMPGTITAHGLIAAIAMRRGQPQGPASDQDVEEFIYDALELLPGAAEVEVRCEGGRVSLTGSVPHKRIKRDAGEIAWAIPAIADVNNTVAITTRRRSRAFTRESESQPSGQGRKQS